MKYDLFLLDYNGDLDKALNTTQKLKELSAPGFIAVCKDADAPFQHETAIQGLFTLDKPILPDSLHKLLADVFLLLQKRKNQVSLIELRSESTTRYVPKENIVYAQFFEEERRIHYCFADGQSFDCIGTIDELCRTLGDYSEFHFKIKNLLVNTDHIKKETKKSLELSNGEVFEYPLLHRIFG
jgi:hypothetical protein